MKRLFSLLTVLFATVALYAQTHMRIHHKGGGHSDVALEQIDSKDYALSFIADSRKLYKIGVTFNSKTRKLEGWKAAD